MVMTAHAFMYSNASCELGGVFSSLCLLATSGAAVTKVGEAAKVNEYIFKAVCQ